MFAPASQTPRAGDPGQAGQGRSAWHQGGSGGADSRRTARLAEPQAQCLKRVFGIDIETCPACGGAVRIIACIEDPVIIEKILTHLEANATEPEGCRLPPCRAPPQASLFD